MSEGTQRKVLSCASCRVRKIKCDKTQPVCLQCSRAGQQCVFPSRKPTRRLPRPRQSELLDRISRLESIVGKADPALLRELDETPEVVNDPSTKPGTRTAGSELAGESLQPSSGNRTTSPGPEEQRSADTAARYLGGDFWSKLCAEVDGIKQALDQSSDEEIDGEVDEASPGSNESPMMPAAQGPSAFMFGNPNYRERESLPHPPRDMMLRLWSIYVRNVDPLVKILHRPTVATEINAFANLPLENSLSPSKNALFFSIYFAAVSTLEPGDCERQLGQKHEVLTARFRMSVERALAAADYLNTVNMETLQAFTIYVTVIRIHNLSLASWALTPVVICLAQTLNLHRDGDGRRFPPYEAEMRRRLWYFITTLDIRGAEDRGSESVLTMHSYNTIPPTNIDDDDFGPHSTAPLVPKPTPAENVVNMCTARCAVFGYIIHPPNQISGQETNNKMYSEEQLIKYVRDLEADFIHTAEPTHMASTYAAEVARMVILKLWLIVQYPFSAQPTVVPMRVSRVTMLRTAVSVMELSNRMETDPWRDRFMWWSRCYVQWHPLAIALAELCTQTEGELVDRAWSLVEVVFPMWRDTVADTHKGPLWKPIKKLYKKAKEARQAALMKNLSINDYDSRNDTPTTSALSNVPMSADPLGELGVGLSGPVDPSVLCSSQAFDTMNMDPSYLFQYPPELGGAEAGQQSGCNVPFDMATWNEFLYDTQMNYSPDGSGGDST